MSIILETGKYSSNIKLGKGGEEKGEMEMGDKNGDDKKNANTFVHLNKKNASSMDYETFQRNII